MENLRRQYNATSAVYDLLDFPFEMTRYRKWRPLLFQLAKGRILEVGVGTGRNIEFYPREDGVVAVDLSEGMLTRAKKRAERQGSSVPLLQMSAYELGFLDETFDTVISTFLFCVLPDTERGLQEMWRVSKREGRVICLEYVLSRQKVRRAWMKMLSPYVRWLYGASFEKDVSGKLKEAGFSLIEERFLLSDIVKLVVAQKAPSF